MTPRRPRDTGAAGRGGAIDAATSAALEANALSQLAALDDGIQALQAHRIRVLAALAHLGVERAQGKDPSIEVRSIAAEIATRARVSDRTVEAQLADAMHLTTTWPRLVEAFGAGRIGRGHLAAITEAAGPLTGPDATPEQRAEYEERMLEVASETSPVRVRRIARREAERFAAEPLVVRHRAAREERRVRVTDADDGMAHLYAFLPAVLARGIESRLLAGWRAKPLADPRTADQWRADALCEVLLTGRGAARIAHGDVPDHLASAEYAESTAATPDELLAGIAATVQVTVPARDLVAVSGCACDAGPDTPRIAALGAAGACTEPAADLAPAEDSPSAAESAPAEDSPSATESAPDCAGDLVRATTGAPVDTDAAAGAHLSTGQPVDAASARILAGAAPTWQRLLLDPATGSVTSVDSYVPTAAQRRTLVARDQHCRFPGCGAGARHADLDHTVAWEHGGATVNGNLAHLCRRHHTLKHASAWSVTQPTPGELHWRSPLGSTYIDRSPSSPHFAPIDQPPRD